MRVLHSLLVPDMYAVLASHDAAEPVRRVRTPEDPQTQSAARLSRVWRRGPAGQLPDPPGGGLPALCQAYRLQVSLFTSAVQCPVEALRPVISCPLSSWCPDAPAARWCSGGSTPSSPTFRRLIARCSTSAPAAPWRSSPPPAPRATSARSTQP